MITEAEVEKILEQTTIEWVAVNMIEFDVRYQRPLARDKVRSIVANYNSIAAGIPILNIRDDGQIFCMDGQHRLTAMKKLEIPSARCMVSRGLTLEQEAQIFVHCNTVRKNPSALDVFKANIIVQDATTLAIADIVEKCGLKICLWNAGSKKKRIPKTIYAVGTLREIYERKGAQFLEIVLKLVLQCWPDDAHALDWLCLKGVAEFHIKYAGKYVPSELVRKMNSEGFDAILRRAKAHAEIMGGSTHITFAVVMQEVYDKSRRTLRLEPDKK